MLLEGLEVAFIVVTFGATRALGLAAAAAASAAGVVVVVAALVVRGPLARVPENRLKYVVGVLLTSFGIFWGGEGAGRRLAGRRRRDPRDHRFRRPHVVRSHAHAPAAAARAPSCGGRGVKYVSAFGRFWWDFIVGDDWRVAAGLAGAFALTWLLAHYGIAAWWVLPVAVAALLAESVWREARSSD